jgi:hypothetical protein
VSNRRHVRERDHLAAARLDAERRAECGHQLAAPRAGRQENRVALDPLALGDEPADLARLDDETRDVAAGPELDTLGGGGLRVREHEALVCSASDRP